MTYTAVLTTRNIENTQILPISGVSDPKFVNPTPNFKIGKYNGFSSYFEHSDNPSWRRLSKFMKPYNFIDFSKAQEKFQYMQSYITKML